MSQYLDTFIRYLLSNTHKYLQNLFLNNKLAANYFNAIMIKLYFKRCYLIIDKFICFIKIFYILEF